jgi:hypothetical protein
MQPESTNSEPNWSFAGYADLIQGTGYSCLSLLRIHYRAGDGERTIRTVECTHWIPTNNGGAFAGKCQLRNELRGFRVDRVERVYDLRSATRIHNLEEWFFISLPRDKQDECASNYFRYKIFLRRISGITNTNLPKCPTCKNQNSAVTTGGDYRCTTCESIFRY